jgi:radical SAM superfamily enzyme YgiQ (UPF0313 family)
MKVALLAPPYPLEEAPSPPLGLCAAAAVFESAGANVRIFDYIVSRCTPEKLAQQLSDFSPDIIGATAVTLNFPHAAEMLKTAKQCLPKAVMIMGGPHVSFAAAETLAAYPEIDLIFLGEADLTIPRWLPVYQNRSAWRTIQGLSFMEAGRRVDTGFGELTRHLDDLPRPARHLLPLSRYRALGFPISLITSRGCPNRCIFCLGRRMVGPKVRYKSVSKIIDEIEDLVSQGFDIINIADDLFTADKKRVKAICRAIIDRDIRFIWSAFVRVDTLSEEILQHMKQAGCASVAFGVESGNPEMLKRIKKGITVEQARQAALLCRKAGIRPHASFIVGLPGETAETLNDSLALVREMDIEYGFHFLSPFPGTTVREHAAAYDLEILSDDWSRYDANSAVVRTSCLSPSDMESFVQRAYQPIVDAWAALTLRVAEGRGTAEERRQSENVDRLNLIYAILSNDLIEQNGGGYSGAAETELIDRLSRRVAEETAHPFDFVRYYIREWVNKKYLMVYPDQGEIGWAWP